MENTLMGTYYHNIDVKGRLNFPTKLRDVLGDDFFVTRGIDECLVIYSKDEWQLLIDKVKELPLTKGRHISRFLFAGASELNSDKQGRVLIPQHLREFAMLEKDIVIIGALNRVEIWNKNKWEEQNNSFIDGSLEDMMEELGF